MGAPNTLPEMILLTSSALAGIFTLFTQPAAVEDGVSFDRDIRPILANRCFRCHGPDAADRKAGLRLDREDGDDGAYRERRGVRALVPGDPEASELWSRVTSSDVETVMPPPESHLDPLDPVELEVLQKWIEGGATYDGLWSLSPPRPGSRPADDPWIRDPIDGYVLERMQERGLEPGPMADARTLLRRLSLDLTGLPPSRSEVEEFVTEVDRLSLDKAYENLVDRLLESQGYGEHMARYWLDLVRFADTNGVHHDHYRELSPYRDWVIRAFNTNLPYDEFLSWQLAGDLYPQPSDDQLIASGFNRLHMIIDRGTALPEESFHRNVIDRVTAVGTAFLGITVQCAVCHDHKYDPISQREFFSLSAFFNNFDGAPETGSSHLDKLRGLQPPYIEFPTEEQEAKIGELDASIASVKAKIEALKADAEEGAPESEELKAEVATQGELEKNRRDIVLAIPAAMVMRERSEVRPTFILERGAYDAPGAPVERGTPECLPPLEAASDVPTRLDLARWFTTEDHPLTARVVVNRLWQQVFGVGLVRTSEDFGVQGEPPSHPALLDHLALSFERSGWDVKGLMRRIVTSATYRQSSLAEPAAFSADPENRLLSRGSRYRLDAEVIRDQILATSGLLNREMYGKSVKPPQPKGIWEAVTLPSSFPRRYEADQGTATLRRSIYTFWKRGMPPPQMSILNAPTRESCTARRERTNTPLQALLLLNESEYLRAARHLAVSSISEMEDRNARMIHLFETVTSSLPSAQERETLHTLVQDLESSYQTRPELASELCAGLDVPMGSSESEVAAWTLLVSTLYNLDSVRTRE